MNDYYNRITSYFSNRFINNSYKTINNNEDNDKGKRYISFNIKHNNESIHLISRLFGCGCLSHKLRNRERRSPNRPDKPSLIPDDKPFEPEKLKPVKSDDEWANEIQRLIRGHLGRLKYKRRYDEAVQEATDHWMKEVNEINRRRHLLEQTKLIRRQFTIDYVSNLISTSELFIIQTEASINIQRLWRGYYYRSRHPKLKPPIKRKRPPMKSPYPRDVLCRLWSRQYFIPVGGWPGKEKTIHYDMWAHADKPPDGPEYGQRVIRTTTLPEDRQTLLYAENVWVRLPIYLQDMQEIDKQRNRDRYGDKLWNSPYRVKLSEKVTMKSTSPNKSIDRQVNQSVDNDYLSQSLSVNEEIKSELDSSRRMVSPLRGAFKPPRRGESATSDVLTDSELLSRLFLTNNNNDSLGKSNTFNSNSLTAPLSTVEENGPPRVLRRVNAPMKFNLQSIRPNMKKFRFGRKNHKSLKSIRSNQLVGAKEDPSLWGKSSWGKLKQNLANDISSYSKSKVFLLPRRVRRHYQFRYSWLPQPMISAAVRSLYPTEIDNNVATQSTTLPTNTFTKTKTYVTSPLKNVKAPLIQTNTFKEFPLAKAAFFTEINDTNNKQSTKITFTS